MSVLKLLSIEEFVKALAMYDIQLSTKNAEAIWAAIQSQTLSLKVRQDGIYAVQVWVSFTFQGEELEFIIKRDQDPSTILKDWFQSKIGFTPYLIHPGTKENILRPEGGLPLLKIINQFGIPG